jgi:hypothetical protein
MTVWVDQVFEDPVCELIGRVALSQAPAKDFELLLSQVASLGEVHVVAQWETTERLREA